MLYSKNLLVFGPKYVLEKAVSYHRADGTGRSTLAFPIVVLLKKNHTRPYIVKYITVCVKLFLV